MTFSGVRVDVLYMRREDIEAERRKGTVSKSDYDRYWKKAGAKHLEEVAVRLSSGDYRRLMAWARKWRHKGGGSYRFGFAVRCGGANQHQDPLNVFFVKEV